MAVNKIEFILEAQQKALAEIQKVSAALKEMQSATTGAARAADQGGSSFGKMFGAMALGQLAADGIKKLGNALMDVAESSIQVAAQREQMGIAFETMIGNAELAKETLMDLRDFAQNTPFTFTSAAEASKQLLAMGISANELLPTLKSLGDVAAGVSVPIGQIALAYGQVRAANQLYGTELRQFVQAGVPLLGTLAKQFNTTEANVKQMVEQGKVGFKDVEKAFQSMSGEGGRFYNLMEKQSKTLAGRWSNLQDGTENLAQGFGEILTPAASAVIESLIELSEKAYDLVYTSEGELQPAMQDTADDLAYLTQFMKDVASATVFVTGKIYELVQALNFLPELSFRDFRAVFDSETEIARINQASSEAIRDMLVTHAEKKGIDMSFLEEQTQESATGVGGASSGMSEAEKAAEDLQKAIEDLGETYVDFGSTAEDAIKSVKETTKEALADIETKITDVASEMEGLTADFLSETQAGNKDIATAFVEQEEKVQALKDALAEAKAEAEPDTKNIADIEAKITAEEAALKKFADMAVALQEQIEEARRFAGLTTFEQTIENLQNEQKARDEEFQDKMQKLADELTALQDQKSKILLLEQSTLDAITRLRAAAGSMYKDILASMATQTAESVEAMIASLDALGDRAGSIGGTNLSESVANQGTSALTNLVNNPTTAESATGASVNVGGITINASIASGADANALVEQIMSELTRRLELTNLGST